MDAQIDKAIGGSGVADDQNSDFGVMFDTLGSGLILIDERGRSAAPTGPRASSCKPSESS